MRLEFWIVVFNLLSFLASRSKPLFILFFFRIVS
eukprot:gene1649-1017_t